MRCEIAIIGVGTQGAMIAFRNAIHGKKVAGYSRTESSVAKCRAKIDAWLDAYVAAGRISRPEADAVRARIRYGDSLEETSRDAFMIIENVPEILETKQALFLQLERICSTETIFSSNTSSLLMSEICKDLPLERKQRTFQVDHDDPVRNDYLEMMWNADTSDETKKAAVKHYRELGFEPVITAREIKGYSINRVWRAVKRECLYLWANDYVAPSEFDRGWMLEWNSDHGPFRMMDVIGLDTIYNIENSYYFASGEERDKPPQKLKDMIDSGNLGKKSGSGFYDDYE